MSRWQDPMQDKRHQNVPDRSLLWWWSTADVIRYVQNNGMQFPSFTSLCMYVCGFEHIQSVQYDSVNRDDHTEDSAIWNVSIDIYDLI